MTPPFPCSDVDEAPAAALYQHYAPTLFSWLRRQTSWEDAEDLLLEVFLAAFERDALLAVPESKRLAWLVSVAQHKLVDQYRRAQRRPVALLADVTETLEDDEARAPEQIAVRREQHRRLHAAVQRLPRAYQEALRLRFADGLRCAEIAAALGKREGAVRILLWRALQALRSDYAGYEDDERGGDSHGA